MRTPLAAATSCFAYLFVTASFFLASSALSAQNSVGSWSGVIVSSACNADEAFNESAECGKSVPGAKLSLYDDTTRVMYGLEPQSFIVTHLGDAVIVRSTVNS